MVPSLAVSGLMRFTVLSVCITLLSRGLLGTHPFGPDSVSSGEISDGPFGRVRREETCVCRNT